jgi:hypothetical protein
MKERLVTLGAALGAFALFVAVFLQSGGGILRGDLPRPASSERRAEGYSAARSWLESEGVRVVPLRERLDTLAGRGDLSATGNLLIVTLPGVTGFSSAELKALDRWVRTGNALLVVAALADAPDWAQARAGLTPGDINLLTGLSFEPLAVRTPRAIAARTRRSSEGFATEPAMLVANGEQAYLRNVHRAVALSDPSADRAPEPWTLKIPYGGFALELAHDRASGAGVLWTRPLGAGRIIVSDVGSLFTNRTLGLADNAQLLANLVAATVAAGGSVIFDDLRQGVGAVYDPARFYHDPRLYGTVGILLALWLAWVLGATRLRARDPSPAAPRESELLNATGGLLARVVRSDEAARRLLEHFLSTVSPGRCALPDDDAQRWDYLEHHPRLRAADIGRLKRWYADARAGRRVPLKRVHELIGRTERRLRS